MNHVFDALLASFVTVAVVFDLRERRIPNWLVLFGSVSGLVFNATLGAGLLQGLLGFAFGIAALILPFALGWLGAGDVKFFAAIGAIAGVGPMPRIFLYTMLSGLVLASFYVFSRGFEVHPFKQVWNDFRLLILTRGGVLPGPISQRSGRKGAYGLAIAAGTFVALYLDPRGTLAGF